MIEERNAHMEQTDGVQALDQGKYRTHEINLDHDPDEHAPGVLERQYATSP
jgi:hypothetical protein